MGDGFCASTYGTRALGKAFAVAFSVTREFNGNKRTTKDEGKLEGDTIKGSSEHPGRDGYTQKSDGAATHAKYEC